MIPARLSLFPASDPRCGGRAVLLLPVRVDVSGIHPISPPDGAHPRSAQ
jgi:hypothetical protein